MKNSYQLSVISEYNGTKEIELIFTGSLLSCKAIKIIAKTKEKQFIKDGKIPSQAKLTYTIEKVGN